MEIGMSEPDKNVDNPIEELRTGLRTLSVVFLERTWAENAPLLDQIRANPAVEAAEWIEQSELVEGSPSLPPGGAMAVRVLDIENIDSVVAQLGEMPVRKQMATPFFGWKPR
jgi:hypothetical protein